VQSRPTISKQEALEESAFRSNLLALSAALGAASVSCETEGVAQMAAELRLLAEAAQKTASLIQASAAALSQPPPPIPD